MKLESISGDRMPWLPMLLEADESEPIVRSYIDDGELLVIRQGNDDIGVALLLRYGDEVEIKNLALVENRRGRGLGQQAIALIVERSRTAGAKFLVVGTADNASGTIRFYERAGFRPDGIRVGFFDAYPEPVVIDGTVTHDMVMLRMSL